MADLLISSSLPENWSERKRILVILAHPDDPEFFCGGTLRRWIEQGHAVQYCLLTKGSKGSSDPHMQPAQIADVRIKEQYNAGSVLGIDSIEFLDYEDGALSPTQEVRKAIVRVIRATRPEIVVSCDPLYYYRADQYINHPDHRAAGEAVLGALFPAAGNWHYYPELLNEDLHPHTVDEAWLASPSEANTIIDITPQFARKLAALKEHRSQIGEITAFEERMLARRTPDSSRESPRFEERFRRLFLK